MFGSLTPIKILRFPTAWQLELDTKKSNKKSLPGCFWYLWRPHLELDLRHRPLGQYHSSASEGYIDIVLSWYSLRLGCIRKWCQCWYIWHDRYKFQEFLQSALSGICAELLDESLKLQVSVRRVGSQGKFNWKTEKVDPSSNLNTVDKIQVTIHTNTHSTRTVPRPFTPKESHTGMKTIVTPRTNQHVELFCLRYLVIRDFLEI